MGKRIGNILRELRKKKDLTQQELAKETCLSASAIKSYESGAREPNSKAMAALEQYFGVTGAYLRGEDMTAQDAAAILQLGDDAARHATAQAVSAAAAALQLTSNVSQHATAQAVNAAAMAVIQASQATQVSCSKLLADFMQLSSEGQKEMLKRMQEYKEMEDARKDKASSNKESASSSSSPESTNETA